MLIQLANKVLNADAYIYLMIFLTGAGLIIVSERLFTYIMRFNLDFKKFLTNLKKMVAAEDLDRAINYCKSRNTSLPLISLRALEAAESDPSSVRGRIEEETIDFLPQLERSLSWLPALATLILLVGILGTIDHLWSAFHSIDVLDTSEKQSSLSHGIAGSLTHTTFGLLVAMLLLTGHQILKSMAVKIAERIHYGATVLTNLLAPAEMAAAYMPVMHSEPVAMTESAENLSNSNEDYSRGSEPAAAEGDNFDDASVEDIKDEEEII